MFANLHETAPAMSGFCCNTCNTRFEHASKYEWLLQSATHKRRAFAFELSPTCTDPDDGEDHDNHDQTLPQCDLIDCSNDSMDTIDKLTHVNGSGALEPGYSTRDQDLPVVPVSHGPCICHLYIMQITL